MSPNRLFRRSARKHRRSATAEATTGQGDDRVRLVVHATRVQKNVGDNQGGLQAAALPRNYPRTNALYLIRFG